MGAFLLGVDGGCGQDRSNKRNVVQSRHHHSYGATVFLFTWLYRIIVLFSLGASPGVPPLS